MVSDGFATTAFSLGKLWRTRRRSLPLDVREAFLDLLIVVQPYFVPDVQRSNAANIAEARTEIKPLIDMCMHVATRAPVTTVLDTIRGNDMLPLPPMPNIHMSAGYYLCDDFLNDPAVVKTLKSSSTEKLFNPQAAPGVRRPSFVPFSGRSWNIQAPDFIPGLAAHGKIVSDSKDGSVVGLSLEHVNNHSHDIWTEPGEDFYDGHHIMDRSCGSGCGQVDTLLEALLPIGEDINPGLGMSHWTDTVSTDVLEVLYDRDQNTFDEDSLAPIDLLHLIADMLLHTSEAGCHQELVTAVATFCMSDDIDPVSPIEQEVGKSMRL